MRTIEGLGGVGLGPEVLASASPLVASLLKSVRVRKFTGEPADLPRFVREWEMQLDIWYGSCPVLPDLCVLLKLRELMDDASVAILDARLEENRQLSYDEFWREFLGLYQRDARRERRAAWHECKLVCKRVGEPTFGEWTRFMATYQARRRMVDDWAEEEDTALVLSQTPEKFREKVVREVAKTRRGQNWVRVHLVDGVSAKRVHRQLEAAVKQRLPDTVFERHHLIVKCQSRDLQGRLLGVGGADLDGKVINIEAAEYFMPGMKYSSL